MAVIGVDSVLDAASIKYTPAGRKDDRHRLKVFLRTLANANFGKTSVSAGWFGDSASYSSGQSVAQVARVQEFGGEGTYGYDVPTGWAGKNIKVPPRPFMRPTFDGNKDKWIDFVKKAVTKELAKGTKGNIKAQFEKLGMMMQGDIVDTIHSENLPPLHLVTVYARAVRKGVLPDNPAVKPTVKSIRKHLSDHQWELLQNLASDWGNFAKPLEDTGEMVSAVSYKVTGGAK